MKIRDEIQEWFKESWVWMSEVYPKLRTLPAVALKKTVPECWKRSVSGKDGYCKKIDEQTEMLRRKRYSKDLVKKLFLKSLPFVLKCKKGDNIVKTSNEAKEFLHEACFYRVLNYVNDYTSE